MLRLSLTLATALVALVLASSASAATLVLSDGTVGPQPFQGWADRALVPTVPGAVTLRLDGCDDLAGCVLGDEPTIALAPDWTSQQVLLHELGHLFDDAMPDWAREDFTDLVGARTWGGDPESNPASEQFAEAYSLCARRRTLRARTYAAYRYAPTPAQHLRACSLIRRAGLAVLAY